MQRSGSFSSMKSDATHWLEGPAYETLWRCLERTASAEAALVEARRRVRIEEEEGR